MFQIRSVRYLWAPQYPDMVKFATDPDSSSFSAQLGYQIDITKSKIIQIWTLGIFPHKRYGIYRTYHTSVWSRSRNFWWEPEP